MKCKPSEDVCLEHSRPLAGATFCEANCKHKRSATHRQWHPLKMTTLRCIDCDAMLPLGPSNDTPPEVAIEMEAAKVVAENYAYWPVALGIDAFAHDDEPPQSNPEAPDWHTGWLAAAIIDHDITTRTSHDHR